LFEKLEPVVDGFERLCSCLPDIDTGEPIDPQDFDLRWQSDAATLFWHLFKKHEGEIAEVYGEWSEPKTGQPLAALVESFDDPQFVLEWCRGQASDLRVGPWPAFGGVGGNRVVTVTVRTIDGIDVPTYRTREAWVVTLPRLFLHLGHCYSAQELYRFYSSLELLAVKRQRNPTRQAAATL
jgi:hypothetical protein